MPLYEYRCTQCGYRFEKIQSFDSVPETECSKCGGTLKRPLTAPAFQFKGSGWYVNDYAPKGASSSAEGGTSSGKADAGESKSAAPESTAKPAASESSKPAAGETAPKSATTTTS